MKNDVLSLMSCGLSVPTLFAEDAAFLASVRTFLDPNMTGLNASISAFRVAPGLVLKEVSPDLWVVVRGATYITRDLARSPMIARAQGPVGDVTLFDRTEAMGVAMLYADTLAVRLRADLGRDGRPSSPMDAASCICLALDQVLACRARPPSSTAVIATLDAKVAEINPSVAGRVAQDLTMFLGWEGIS